MRVVAGSWRGRRIEAPAGATTRPTTDRVREALFSSLFSVMDADLGGVDVLDAFAGSGALGLEALSRGARRATFVERDGRALAALRANTQSLGANDRGVIRAGDAFALADRGALGGPYALILLDPPYTLDPATVGGLLVALQRSRAVAECAVASWERSAQGATDWPAGWEVVATKQYGDTCIEIATFEGGEQGQ